MWDGPTCIKDFYQTKTRYNCLSDENARLNGEEEGGEGEEDDDNEDHFANTVVNEEIGNIESNKKLVEQSNDNGSVTKL